MKLIFRNASKAFGAGRKRKVILSACTQEISFSKGLAVLGQQGSGKSTLLRMMMGVELPDTGSITIPGRTSWPIASSSALQPQMSGRENTDFVAQVYGLDCRATCDDVQTFSQLGSDFDVPVAAYSNNMKSRLSFAISISVPMDTYIIDDTSTVGDKNFKEKCLTSLRALQEKATFIVVSKNENLVRETCDCFAVLANGRLSMYTDADQAYGALNA
jgi:capsular polysaccharide transport system ATP-binding protein